MLEITVNPIVLETLKQHFPKANSAKNSLDKYIKLLTAQLRASEIYGRSAWIHSKGFYSISVYKQRNRGSQIGSQKIRLQNWLEDNNLELFEVSILGTNMSKKLSVVKLTELITLKNTVTVFKSQMEQETDNLKELLDDQKISNKQFFEHLYPEIGTESEEAVNALFDFVPIDMTSLRNYIEWLQKESIYIETRKKQQYLTQADTILRVAQHTDGFYIQRKKDSSFGRHYYSGTSVQNVNKELRRAMLGHCWEYDIRSSVFAWKMGFAKECYQSLKFSESFEKTFSVTLNYLSDKKEFMSTVRYYTFKEDSNVSRELQEILLKRALTAISFGARDKTHGWRQLNGEWINPALVLIITNHDERIRFLNCPFMKKFISEQNMLDKYIYQSCKSLKCDFLNSEDVRTFSGSLSKSKVIAYLYQHAETQVMDVAQVAIESCGGKVLARIHDAIILQRRLGVDNKFEVQEAMCSTTDNKYWHLTAKELEQFNRPYSLDKVEIDAHQERIRQEELRAKDKKKSGVISKIFDWMS